MGETDMLTNEPVPCRNIVARELEKAVVATEDMNADVAHLRLAARIAAGHIDILCDELDRMRTSRQRANDRLYWLLYNIPAETRQDMLGTTDEFDSAEWRKKIDVAASGGTPMPI
ncbi:MAG: hypothetical protein AB7O86_12335 [Porticoccaceae bacterium]